MRSAEANQPAFFRSGVFILLPLLLLAGLGLYSLRQDRRAAGFAAGERCQPVADLCANQISQAIDESSASIHSISQILINSNGALLSISGRRSRAVLVDCPQPHPLFLTDLNPEQAALWRQASASGLALDDGSNAASALRRFISLQPPPQFLAQALYDLALAEKSPRLFQDVETNRQALSEAGLPLWLLAQIQRVKLDPSSTETANVLCSNAVNYPSFATPMILVRTPQASSWTWREAWDADEKARDLYATAKPRLPSAHSFWIEWHAQSWLVSCAFEGRLVPLPFEAFSNSVQSIIRACSGRLPPYAALTVTIGGRDFLSAPTNLPVLVDSIDSPGVTAAHYPDPWSHPALVRVRILIADSSLLYAEQSRRTLWFAALILVSALAATIALVNSHRAFLQQVRVGEMKTNFVSSVSHELRAPIASMRLLAEGLDRGKISDPPKQKEYYKLLAQESRRLSTLVENILDYSRIDQGRKTYEMQPTDLPALVQQTVALMTPAAADRRVSIVAPPPNTLQDATVVCDGFAMQQALINLLDNAIKHSPPGATVTVGLERAGHLVSLWVEDSGPGIPLHEREKIFARFYRRGTELRRETQGIGIGLTIVKHIIEAHQGRVLVTSEVGRGSRFTLEWPVDESPATA